MMPWSPTAMSRGPAAATAMSSDCAASRAGSAARGGGAAAGACAAASAGVSAATSAQRSAGHDARSTPAPKSRSDPRRGANLTDSAPLEHARLIVRGRALDVEVVGLRLLALQAEREVAPVGQIHDQLEVRPQCRQVVVIHRVPFLHAVELPARVIAVDQQDLPGVLVDVERAAAVDLAHALLERRIDHPDTVHLVAREAPVDVILLHPLRLSTLP